MYICSYICIYIYIYFICRWIILNSWVYILNTSTCMHEHSTCMQKFDYTQLSDALSGRFLAPNLFLKNNLKRISLFREIDYTTIIWLHHLLHAKPPTSRTYPMRFSGNFWLAINFKHSICSRERLRVNSKERLRDKDEGSIQRVSFECSHILLFEFGFSHHLVRF